MGQLRLKTKTETSGLATFFFFLFFFLLWRCVLSNTNKDNQIVGDEAAYLKKLRKAISPAPNSWFNVTNMCDWGHVTCTDNGLGRTIEEINLISMSLNGTLPPGLNNSLVNLKRLILTNNSLTGPLPSLAGLSLLQELKLDYNNFTSIPSGCFQGLSSLQLIILDFNTNLAPWTFPASLTDSSQLTTLSLSTTNLMGPFPDTFDSFRNLQIIDLSYNNLTGVLSKSFTKLNLRWLFLVQQKLTGKIEFLSSMTHLEFVFLQENSFEGPIPDLSNCTKLQEFSLADNQLTGVVPPSLMNLPILYEVSLDNNWLQGPMPLFNKSVITGFKGNGFCLDHRGPCHHTVTTLLQVAKAFGFPLLLARSWRGNNPCNRWRFISCDIQGKIRTVNLTKLNLTGTISPAFGNLSDLRELHLSGNNLSESVPGDQL